MNNKNKVEQYPFHRDACSISCDITQAYIMCTHTRPAAAPAQPRSENEVRAAPLRRHGGVLVNSRCTIFCTLSAIYLFVYFCVKFTATRDRCGDTIFNI